MVRQLAMESQERLPQRARRNDHWQTAECDQRCLQRRQRRYYEFLFAKENFTCLRVHGANGLRQAAESLQRGPQRRRVCVARQRNAGDDAEGASVGRLSGRQRLRGAEGALRGAPHAAQPRLHQPQQLLELRKEPA